MGVTDTASYGERVIMDMVYHIWLAIVVRSEGAGIICASRNKHSLAIW